MLPFISQQSIANVWSEFKTPYSMPSVGADEEAQATEIDSLAIGSYANGCLAGAETLPLEGEGYQVIRTSRARYYGHPELIFFIQGFAKQVHPYTDKDLLIADISMPRGGNFVSGHASHQIGLDVDIWFRQAAKLQTRKQRESPLELSLVDKDSFEVNGNWQAAYGEMIRLAAENPQVARVFVNPAIKHKLCKLTQADATSSHDHWLSKVRPWWGHKIHMHVRLKCPLDDKLCQNQRPPESGTGCDKLGWWREQVLGPAKPARTETKITKPKPIKVKPEQCQVLLK
ncbi:penicillin-insensitive murein endopeptidase [Shewanella eurypsychrophilus]|uniref:Penicillin-insensitive murein endopeptidase n=2 Tax=Shewanellaceae TaxID=267890 RepID=A0ABX6VCA2_9GAMM|nr:penicillin-insensitive murein endopeptidase [Shewanella sp. YLB-09]QPG60313.1 penicillin-insensitive murein endopeptidase [Shewanella eurypsychrophilus]